jgi:chromosome segregation ATPase
MTPNLHLAGSEPSSEFESVSDAELVADELERPLRSPDSGAYPSPGSLAARVEAAMAASARTEAALLDLVRTAKFLSASIGAVRSANAELERELEVLCAALDGDGAQRVRLERRVQRLERVLEGAERDAKSEREFLIAQHDAFIASLISDHERELASLKERLPEESEPADAHHEGPRPELL